MLMTIEQAKSELMQIYGALSPNKQIAIDTLVKIELCEDAISRQAVLGIVRDMKGLARAYVLPEAINQVKSLPPVNPQEPKTGHWILDETDNSITCDKCGCLIWANDISNGDAHYCPNCGAKMKSEVEG